MNITTVQMEQSDKIFTIASLFAGIGGIDLGFIKSGFNVAWANETGEKSCIFRSRIKKTTSTQSFVVGSKENWQILVDLVSANKTIE